MPEYSQMNEKVLRWYLIGVLKRIAHNTGNKALVMATDTTFDELDAFVKKYHGEPITEKGMERFAKDGRNAKL